MRSRLFSACTMRHRAAAPAAAQVLGNLVSAALTATLSPRGAWHGVSSSRCLWWWWLVGASSVLSDVQRGRAGGHSPPSGCAKQVRTTLGVYFGGLRSCGSQCMEACVQPLLVSHCPLWRVWLWATQFFLQPCQS